MDINLYNKLTNNTIQKFGAGKNTVWVLRKNIVKKVILWNIISTLFYFSKLFIPVMAKLFSSHYSNLWCNMILQKSF